MAKALVVVESPAKAKTINKYLGRDYKVVASMGHIRDLPKSKLGVDVEVLLTGYRLEQREPALKRLRAANRLACVWAEFQGGTAATHERTTGRAGSFQEARGALEQP